MKRKQNDAAASAWLKARESGAAALPWLMRAARLAPDDPRIALELAQAQLRQGDADPAAGVPSLAHTHDIAAAWTGLALAHAKTGEMQLAAQALAAMLTRHCLAEDPSFTAFAMHVATATGPGG